MAQGPTKNSPWDQIANLVDRQIHPTSFPSLITERGELVKGPASGAINYVLELLFREAIPSASNQFLIADANYHDVPLSGAYFLNLLTATQRLVMAKGHAGPAHFLDMGCGVVTKVSADSAIFDVAHGVDYMPECINHAYQFFDRVRANQSMIQQANALTFNRYGNYDVIYFYRPLKDTALASQMEKRILSQVASGTILVAPISATRARSSRVASRVFDKVYMAHTPPAEAQKMCNVAVTM